MAADINPSTSARLEIMQQQIQRLERELLQIRSQRLAVIDQPREFRLCKTVSNPSAEPTYPTSGNTFPIMFLDGHFPLTAGDQTPTWVNRDSAGAHHTFAHNLTGTYLPVGTICKAHRIGGASNSYGDWWIERATAGRTILTFQGDIVDSDDTGLAVWNLTNKNTPFVDVGDTDSATGIEFLNDLTDGDWNWRATTSGRFLIEASVRIFPAFDVTTAASPWGRFSFDIFLRDEGEFANEFFLTRDYVYYYNQIESVSHQDTITAIRALNMSANNRIKLIPNIPGYWGGDGSEITVNIIRVD